MAANIKSIVSFLRRVYLGGKIEECVVQLQPGGTASVVALDMTNTLFVTCSSDIGLSVRKATKIGIGDLERLCKVMEAAAAAIATPTEGKAAVPVKVLLQGNRLIIERADGQSVVRFLLSDPETVATAPQTDKTPESILEGSAVSAFALTPAIVNDVVFHIGLLRPVVVRFVIDEEGSVTLYGGREMEHQFELVLGSMTKASSKGKRLGAAKAAWPLELVVHSDPLLAVLQVLNGGLFEGENVVVKVAPEKPLLIFAEKPAGAASDIWVIAPAEGAGEAEQKQQQGGAEE